VPWVRIDDELPDHPKLAEMGIFAPLAEVLHLHALCWCNRKLTDGYVPWGQVPKLANFDHIGIEVSGDEMTGSVLDVEPRRLAAELVRAGMWHEVEGGYYIHDYLEYQPSRQDTEEKRRAIHDARSKAGMAGAISRWGKKPQVDDGKIATEYQTPRQTDGPKPVPKPKDIEEQVQDPPTRASVEIIGKAYERATGNIPPSTLLALCPLFTTEVLVEAITQAALAEKPRPAYIRTIADRLKAEGWTPSPILTAVPDAFEGL
jgi:hypothetical protein